MSEITGIAARRVVNLADYKAARAAAAGDQATEASPASTPMPARLLLPREIEHRERMLRHLRSAGT